MNIAILGYGTIGKGVFTIVKDNPSINVVKILEKKEKYDNNYINLFTSSIDDIINDDKIDLIVEVMGGYDFAKKCIIQSLNNKKHVVTANKEVIAQDIDELLTIAKKNNVSLLYEASVGGGIPIIKNIKEIALINKIYKITGILNGTTNYIITNMFNGMSFNDALTKAKELGFAEADPTADLEGYDMMRKIAILSDLAWNTKIDINLVKRQSFLSISQNDIELAIKENKVIKYVCEATMDNNEIKIGVMPKIFDRTHLFSNINYEVNAIILETYPNDTLSFIGKGAGSLPTASAIVNDIVDIMNNKNYEYYENINKYIINKESK